MNNYGFSGNKERKNDLVAAYSAVPAGFADVYDMKIAMVKTRTIQRWAFAGVMMVIFTALSGCSNFENDVTDEPDLYSAFDFSDSTQGWIGGFSGYPAGMEDSLDLFAGYMVLPDGLNGDKKTLTVSGKNPQKNLFYFVKKQVKQLRPNATYQVYFDVQFVLETREGNPHDGEVYVKFGAFHDEPEVMRTSPESMTDTDKEVLNVEIGTTPEEGGAYVQSMGALILPEVGESKIFKASNKERRIVVNTDDQGNLWLLVGFDSTVDAHLAFYFENINAYYKEI